MASQSKTGNFQQMLVSRTPPAIGANTAKKEAAAINLSTEEPVTVRALVPIEPAKQVSLLRPVRPEASFIAHLLATVDHAPQARALRRASPAAARATYDRAAAKGCNGYGKVLSQTA